MTVHTYRVTVPAWSSVGYGYGHTEIDGKRFRVSFVGDHRPMRELCEAMQAHHAIDPDATSLEAEVEEYQLLTKEEV